jgi:hypothetical protein
MQDVGFFRGGPHARLPGGVSAGSSHPSGSAAQPQAGGLPPLPRGHPHRPGGGGEGAGGVEAAELTTRAVPTPSAKAMHRRAAAWPLPRPPARGAPG